eukprot:scaffold8988_cov112-Isochrysis_galbana.AAC.6
MANNNLALSKRPRNFPTHNETVCASIAAARAALVAHTKHKTQNKRRRFAFPSRWQKRGAGRSQAQGKGKAPPLNSKRPGSWMLHKVRLICICKCNFARCKMDRIAMALWCTTRTSASTRLRPNSSLHAAI